MAETQRDVRVPEGATLCLVDGCRLMALFECRNCGTRACLEHRNADHAACGAARFFAFAVRSGERWTVADPIRIASCRPPGDVRCPVCELMQAGRKVTRLACGCRRCTPICAEAHLSDLLAEAIRQQDAALAEIERLRHWHEDETAEFSMSREVVQALREERDAAKAQAKKAAHCEMALGWATALLLEAVPILSDLHDKRSRELLAKILELPA